MIARMTHWAKDQRGITGLETAIILIAFVVVASVFAYTVLSAGIFSSEKGREAIHSGLEQARSSMEVIGPVIGKDTDSDGDYDQIVFIVGNSLDGEAVNLTTTTDADSDGILSDESTRSHNMTVTYLDKVQTVEDVTWTKTAVGRGDGDDLLEAGEKFEVTVTLSALSTVLDTYDTFTLEVKPARGSTLVLQRTTPAVVDKITNFN